MDMTVGTFDVILHVLLAFRQFTLHGGIEQQAEQLAQ